MKLLIAFIVTAIVLSFLAGCSSNLDRQTYFNESAGSPEYQPDKVIEVLKIQNGWYIGDLGAGGGYYTYRFAEETGPSGKVYAADINQEFLAGIDKTAKNKGFNNVHIISSNSDDSNFEEKSLDLIFTRNTFHHIDNKNNYMKKLAHKIKDDGKIALIDYKKDASYSPSGHSSSRDEIISSIDDTGLIVEKEYEFLEKQYFFILIKQSTP